MKPKIYIDLDDDARGALPTLDHLSAVDGSELFHEGQDKRHPLGIYNLSVSRVCRKVTKACEALEDYASISSDIDVLRSHSEKMDELIERLELCLYAAAEHIDDIESLACCFFRGKRKFNESKEGKRLKRSLKPIRNRISAITNAIKHNQSRIRIFSAEFTHDKNLMCLHGFFIESFSEGKVGPCTILHTNDEQVISITSFLWDVVIYLAEVSKELDVYLSSLGLQKTKKIEVMPCSAYRNAASYLARLPVYTFDDPNPFDRVTVTLLVKDASGSDVHSGIYGSLTNPWTKSDVGQIGKHAHFYEGDGATTSFAIVQPRKLSLSHWS